ncbi:hypothetical protein [Luteolibacter luteus]|uniref:Uncharacterized protein n=1 Tax=Luteolibacter luteus TaxID=2728835 RepID=A0A858RLH6_9BACT|nr:hypothetical protein [Luteolibacter luteus]QJE97807.1 hypothetical protein HHL09_19140 [Luteolibacter luteus]
MKLLFVFIIACALVLGLRQRQESVRLAGLEKDLVARNSALGRGEAKINSEIADGSPAATKIARTEQPKFSAAKYLGKYYKIFLTYALTRKEPGIRDGDFVRDDLLNATPEDLARLPKDIRDAMLPDVIASGIYEVAASGLLDKDPKLACEFALKGGIINTFLYVVRSWMARDPLAACAWLEEQTKTSPPLDEKTFQPIYCHQEPLDLASLRLAAGIAASPAAGDLSGLMDLEGARLRATLDDVLMVLPSDCLPVLLKRVSESGRPDLLEQILKQHPEPAMAREYLKDASLPPEEFMRAATVVVASLDPVSLPRGLDWYLRSTDPEARAEGLQEIVARWGSENPDTAAQWLKKLPEGKDRQLAETAYEAGLQQARDKRISPAR